MDGSTSFVQLMSRLDDGDSVAATTVHQRYAQALIRLASSRISARFRSKFDAEDVVQSAFRSFYARNLNGDFEIGSWDNLWALLVAITLRKCRGNVAHLTTKKRDVRRESSHGLSQTDSGLDDREPTPEEAATLEDIVRALMDKLESEYQQIVLLRLQNFSSEEIAAGVGCSERTVYRVLTDVRRHLRALIS